MTISHHPAEEYLLAYGAGTLDAGTHVAIATHLNGCHACRGFVGRMEDLGGTLLDALPGDAMGADAFDRIEALLDAPVDRAAARTAQTARRIDTPGLPPFVRRLEAGAWRWVAPGIRLQPLKPPAPSEARLFLLRARAGMRMLPHGHSGLELTCVLEGSFSHSGQRFAPGDFDCGNQDDDHAIAIGEEGECLCLVALTGKLQFRGLAGRVVQPFIAI